ncbi:hypothetical protein MMC22_005325 [Lobaria immixta]|nr:hypothetical protein [Lobaria immixta]
MDPIFALFIGLSAAVVRIRRDQRDQGRDARLLPLARHGWDLVRRRWKGEVVVASTDGVGFLRR